MRPFFLDTNHHADCAEALLTAMARRHPRNTFMSARFAINLLLREGECVSLEQVQEGMRQLQKNALGILVEDENQNIGFLWEQAPCVALARKKMDHQFMPTVHVDTLQVKSLRDYQDPLPEHVLQLRDKCAVLVSMPTDLTEDEFKRIAHFVMALVDKYYTDAADLWPFKRPREDSDEDGEFRKIKANFINDDDEDDDEFGYIDSDDDEDLDEDRDEDFDDLNDEDDDEKDVDDGDSEKKSGV